MVVKHNETKMFLFACTYLSPVMFACTSICFILRAGGKMFFLNLSPTSLCFTTIILDVLETESWIWNV